MSKDSPRVEFVDLPPRRNSSRDADVAEACRARPGEWALLGEFVSSKAAQIKSGTTAAFRPAGDFDATTRRVDGNPAGRTNIYVRYVGVTE